MFRITRKAATTAIENADPRNKYNLVFNLSSLTAIIIPSNKRMLAEFPYKNLPAL